MEPAHLSRRACLGLLSGGAAAGLLAACGGTASVDGTATAAAPSSSAVAATSATTPPRAVAATRSTGGTAVAPSAAKAPVAPSTTSVAAKGASVRVVEWDVPPEPFGVWLHSYLQAFPAQTGIKLEILLANHARPLQEEDTWVASGDVPDIFYRSGSGAFTFAAYAVKKVIQPLTPFVDRDRFDLSDFWPDALRQLSGQGKLWVMPQDFNQAIWAYNATDFRGAGLPLPPTSWSDTSWTWDSFLHTAQQMQQYLTRQNAAGGHYAMGRFGVTGNWEMWVWTNGGKVVSDDGKTLLLDQPAALAALDFAAKLATTYHVAPGPGDKLAAPDAMALGKSLVAIDLLHAAGVSNQIRAVAPNLDFDVTTMAHGAGGYVASGVGDGYVLAASSRAPDQAWELLKYLGAPEYAKNKVSYGGLGARSSAAHQYFVRQGKPPVHAALYFDAAAHSRWEPNLTNWAEVATALGQALAPVWQGKQTAKEAVAGAKQSLQSLLQQGELFV